jgi:hypothetical protein
VPTRLPFGPPLEEDGDGQGVVRIDVVDSSSRAVLDSQTLSAFGSGEYLVWDLSGHVQLRVTSLSGSGAIVSGLFFG